MLLLALTLILFSKVNAIVLNSKSCATNEYYNIANYVCKPCGGTAIPNSHVSSDKTNCVCDVEYLATYDNNYNLQCTSCIPQSLTYIYPWCLPPSSASYSKMDDKSDYRCNSNDQYLYITYGDTQYSCLSCATNSGTLKMYAYNGVKETSCHACPSADLLPVQDSTKRIQTGPCICQDSSKQKVGNSCLTSAEYSDYQSYSKRKEVKLNKVETFNPYDLSSVTVTSSLITEIYDYAVGGCIYGHNITACQELANLCALTFYQISNAVCASFINYYQSSKFTPINDPNFPDTGRRNGIPWIFYESSGDQVLYNTRKNFSASLEASYSSNMMSILNFYVAKYTLNGTYIETSSLKDELIFCATIDYRNGQNFKVIGTNYKIECPFNFNKLALNASFPIFYEVFLLDNTNNFLDVPILIKNYQNSDGSYPNYGSDYSKWKYVRRFAMYDNILFKPVGSSTSVFVSAEQPSYVSYVRDFYIRIEADPNSRDNIISPTIEIEYYSERITNENILVSNGSYATFRSAYFMGTKVLNIVGLSFLIALSALALIITFIQIYVWTKNNPSQDYPNFTKNLIGNFIFYLVNNWSTIFFWFLFGIIAIIFIFFKWANTSYMFLPQENDSSYKSILIIFIVVLIARLFSIFMRIIKQSSYDIFFIDWEKPKTEIRRNRQIKIIEGWRTVFLANEYTEMQSERLISMNLIYFIYLGLITWELWWNWSQEQPTYSYYRFVPNNPYLQFFVIVIVMMTAGGAQYIIKFLLKIWFPTHVQNLVDLASITNISIFILTDKLHGYYIHGQNPSGESDTNAEALKTYLDNESLGKLKDRGIGNPNQESPQVFEIFIYPSLRKKISEIQSRDIKLAQFKIQTFGSQDKNKEESKEDDLKDASESFATKIQNDPIENQKEDLNELLKRYLDDIKNNHTRMVLEKGICQYLCSWPSQDPENLENSSLFYTDNRLGFTELFIQGFEFDMIQLICLSLWFFNYVSGSIFCAIPVTFIIQFLIDYIRSCTTSWNISKKSLIDSRFLK